MWIVALREHTQLSDGTKFKKGVRYVVPRVIMNLLIQTGEQSLLSFSSFNTYERKFAPDGKIPNVLLYRHDAYGDQLMCTAVARAIQNMHRKARVDVVCGPNVTRMWDGIANVCMPTPMEFEMVQQYNWHILYDEMLESDGEPEQVNAYDGLLQYAGIDPESVPDSFKRPTITVSPKDCGLWDELREKHVKKGKYLLYQLQTSNYTRTYPPELGAEFLAQWVENRPDWPVIVVGRNERKMYSPFPEQSRDEAQVFTDILKERTKGTKGMIISLIDGTKDFRLLNPLVANAGLVVTPDTALGHVAAAFPGVPTISLWGVFSPDDRAKYYPNHHPMVGQGCPHAPCHCHLFRVPASKCKDAVGDWHTRAAPYCNAIANIKPEEILEKAMELTS